MWERIVDAGFLVVGAIVLFVVFSAILFLYESRDQKKQAQRPVLRVIRCDKQDRAA